MKVVHLSTTHEADDVGIKAIPPAWAPDLLKHCSATCAGGIVTVSPEIASRFPPRETLQVRNHARSETPGHDPFAMACGSTQGRPLSSVGGEGECFDSRPNAACFLGSMTAIRGITETVKAVSLLPAELEPKLILAGEFAPASYRDEIESLWDPDRVEFLGQIPAEELPSIYARSRATVVPYHPCPNHTDASPNKMFEGMAAGLPVIASDFPKWRPIIEQHGCGLLVDPLKPESIAEALRWIFEHPDEAEAMGERGRAAAREHYTWESQAAKLLDLYHRIARN
jgi:glycosyltransferase involved in cell wall biosynthesis